MIKFTDYQDLVKDYKEYKKLFNASVRAESKRNPTQSDIERSEALLEKCKNIEKNVLPRKTFEILVKLNPFVRERRTNSFFHFKDIYGEDFDALESDGMIGAVVSYLDIGSYAYPLCEQVERPDGDIQDVKEYRPCSTGYETPIWKDGKVVDYGYNCGIPYNYYFELPNEVTSDQYDKWHAMSQEEKEEWMKNKSWKTLVEKYIK